MNKENSNSNPPANIWQCVTEREPSENGEKPLIPYENLSKMLDEISQGLKMHKVIDEHQKNKILKQAGQVELPKSKMEIILDAMEKIDDNIFSKTTPPQNSQAPKVTP
ncbi:MAG: hypothetical protein K1X66_00745 [Verrucomicrobiae bacterium]|nr:hypothetical protein [Verrucomicrobiae bacterium]